MMKLTASILLMLFLVPFSALAEENVGQPGKQPVKTNKVAAACQPATAQIDLDINNVRTRLLAGGDMWWDLNDAKYEIPRVEPGSGDVAVHSLFAGALWIGGIDAGGQLKVAAQTYRQGGNDFFPGPLNANGSVDDAVCNVFDRHWKVTRGEIDEFIAAVEASGGSVPLAQIPRSILEWPGRGNPHAVGAKNTPLNLSPSKNLAPFEDYDGDGLYNPENGDYPDVFGDQAIWWVYNDKGDIHTETGAEAIGLEVQALAFAFGTNDEINDMTFYQYNVQNFSTSKLDSVYFGQWVDADLGYAFDDFVGVDADLALGICYNGDAEDGPAAASYGVNPPIVGVDFFQGPIRYTYDQNDNIIDSTVLGMSKFLYYNNDFTVIGNPEIFSHYYGYLSGTWKDGTPVTYGGDGYGGTDPADFMFPSDPSDNSTNAWSECLAGNDPDDRRFIQSSGPFRLDPGANNEVVVGVVWVRPSQQISCNADFDALRVADEKAQALYDNGFKLIDGPDAPDMAIRELDREIIISLTNNPAISNNYNESYSETDPIIKSIVESLQDTNVTDSTYDFQGYIIYQLRDNQVSSSELRDLGQARVVAQVDIEDGIANIVNQNFDAVTGREVPQLMVSGSDQGIRHSFRITDDAFASGNTRLVNNKTYYYSVVAYAHNNYLPFEAGNDISQKEPYLEGRSNIKVYSAIPHLTDPEIGGTALNASYGDGPEITRIEGVGNGANVLEFTTDTENEIVANGQMANPVYKGGNGPIDVKVYDPVKVPAADFELVILDTSPSPKVILNGAQSYWVLRNLTTGDEYYSDKAISIENEQIIPEVGLSITIGQKRNPGTYNGEENNGLLESSKTYADPGQQWLTGVADGDGVTGVARYFNWIRAGTNDNAGNYSDYTSPLMDEDGVYEDVVDGTFGPMPLLGGLKHTVEQNPLAPLRLVAALTGLVKMDSLASIDLVFTPDKSKWTRCVVLEMSDNPEVAEGNVPKLGIRDHASLNLDGTYDQSSKGLSWFPGYAVNKETGRRLNIIFTEDSWLKADNGDDMIWNPTSNTIIPAGPSGSTIVFGGKHYIFVSNTTYDEGQAFHSMFNQGSMEVAIRNTLRTCIWASMSYLAPGNEFRSFEEGLIPTETRIRIRVTKPYRTKNFSGTNNGYPTYQFSTQGLAPTTNSIEVAKTALDHIRVVPNPYYAYSQYERSQLDNRVRITNLPPVCTVTIYSTDGTLIRRFKREAAANNTEGGELTKGNFNTSIDWDLTNTKNIPVASGMYVIHIEAPDIGEKTVKWFGTMRPIDLDTF